MTVALHLEISAEALRAWRIDRAQVAAAAFQPKSRLTLSEWADQKRILSSDLGEGGPWRTARVPYLRRPMDAITDPRVRRVTVMKSARIGATQALVLNTIGYYIDQEPSPIIVGLPTIDDATKFSTQLLQPMLDDSPCLAERVQASRASRKRSTMLQKAFPGGGLQIVGTKSPRALRMVHGRIILKSEIDAYEFSAGQDGDPSTLLDKRATGYGSPKFIEESTPLVRALSRILPAFEEGSQEYFEVPCPHCGAYQRLVWGKRQEYGVQWDREHPERPYYVCEHGGCVIPEREKYAMVDAGAWKATFPERTEHLSFHLNALISPFPGARWPRLVAEFRQTHRRPEKLRVFVNTVLGEPWEDEGESLNEHALAAHVSDYQPRVIDDGHEFPDRSIIPAGAAVIVRVTDTQNDRLETAVWAFGPGEQAWLVDFDLLPGSPAVPPGQPGSPWDLHDETLARVYQHARPGGIPMRVSACFLDSGGHHSNEVYAYTKARNAKKVYAIKGLSEQEGAPIVGKPTRNNRAKAILIPVGSFTAKEVILSRLTKITDHGPGYIHLPDWLDTEQLNQFTRAKLITIPIAGRPRRKWVESGRVEQFHLAAYAIAALHFVLGAKGPAALDLLHQQLLADGDARTHARAPGTSSASAAPPPPPAPHTRRRMRSRGVT